MNDAGVSSEPKQKTPEQRDKWNAYMRAYRKNRRIREKLASGETIAIGSSNPTPEPESSIPESHTQGA